MCCSAPAVGKGADSATAIGSVLVLARRSDQSLVEGLGQVFRGTQLQAAPE